MTGEIIDPRIIILKEGEIGTRPSWDEYLMARAMETSSRSSCHQVHSGSIIANVAHEVVGSGYNGAPGRRKKNCLEVGCAVENAGHEYGGANLGVGDCVGIHSEKNALGHMTKLDQGILHTLYTTIFTCKYCAKDLQAYPIGRVVFKRFYDSEETEIGLRRLADVGIEVCQLDMSPERKTDINLGRKAKKFGLWSPEQQIRADAIRKFMLENMPQEI
jgi:dCMP deaminase